MGSNERSAHIATDARLAAMIRHLDGIYSEAHAELAEKWEAYLLRKDKRLKKLWEAFRDALVDNNGTVEATAEAIWRDYCEHYGT